MIRDGIDAYESSPILSSPNNPKAQNLTSCGKKSLLRFILGGATVYSCDNWLPSASALAVEIGLQRGKYFSAAC